MTPKEAAEALRPTFHLHSMPPEARHHMEFVEKVAAELEIEPTPFNLHQVAEALDEAEIKGDSIEYPKMLYSRQHHAVKDVAASVYLPRHDAVAVHVESQEQADALGHGWFSDLNDLPPRGDTPLHHPKIDDDSVVTL